MTRTKSKISFIMTENQLKVRAATVMILVLIIFVFAVQNAKFVDVQIFALEIHTPRSVLIFVILAIGVYIGWSSRVIYRFFVAK